MTSTEDDMTKRAQIRASFAAILEKARLAAVEGPLREQFLTDLRELTDAEQDSKELKSAKRDLLLNRILEEIELPFPVGSAPAEGEPAVKDSQTKQYVKRAFEAVYKDLVRKKIAVDKRRPDGRSEEEIRHGHGRGAGQPAHARLRALHARADADHDAADARDDEGGSADRRPLPRAEPPLHAPLQLPALLGRGDGLHARPEAA